MPRLVQGDGRDDGNLVLRSATSLAARQFSAEVGAIDLDLSPQQVVLLTISHRPQYLVVQQPRRVVLHAQVAAELQRGHPGIGLADQVKGQKPSGQRQFGALHYRADRERGLMAAVATRIALEPPPVDAPMLVAIAAGPAEPIRPTSLLQGSLTLLLGAVEPLKAWQREAFLKMDAAARHDQTGNCVPVYSPGTASAERAG